MYKKCFLAVLMFLFMGACVPDNTMLDTENLKVEQEEINTIYVPVEKDIADEAIPFDIEYPSYLPFDNEETKVVITGWENSEEKIVSSIRYPSVEEEAKWQEGSITQPAIPNVVYTVANFDRYYSRYSDMNDYKTIEITEDISGVIKYNEGMKGGELHWFNEEKEYNLILLYFSEDKEKLKRELIQIANSI